MRGYYWRWSNSYIGFGMTPGALWPRLRLGFLILEIFPGEIASRIEKLLAAIHKERGK